MAVQTQAQVKQSLLDSLDGLGANKADFDDGNVFTDAEKDVAAFIERVKANIDRADMILTGGIGKISLRVTQNGIQVLGNDYLLYQDRGVQGSEDGSLAPNSPHKYTDKAPPLQVFIDYVERKNLNLRNEAQYTKKGEKSRESSFKEADKDELIRQVAYLIQQKVFKFGFKPRDIFAKEVPKLKADLAKSIKNFAASSIKECFLNDTKI